MRKKIFFYILIIFIIVIILISLPFKHKVEKTNDVKITVGEVTHSVFYTPLYVSLEKGYFKANGLNVRLSLISGADKVSAAVLSGDVQIGFAGAESAIYVYKNGEKDYLQIFSGLTKRDGQFILARQVDKNFTLDNLKGKEIIVGRQGGMPALNFLNALKNSGINQDDIHINYSIDFASLSGAFIGNIGDYVNLFDDSATIINFTKKDILF